MTDAPKKPMRLIVCGGRSYLDRLRVFAVLDAIHRKRGISRIIQGGASGADAWAREWAKANSIRCGTYHADWHLHGRAAGPIRNAEMLKLSKPDGVVAFPGKAGTAHMVRIAKEAGLPVMEVKS